MGLVRRVRQFFAGAELSTFARDFERVEERLAVAADQLTALAARFDRLQNRVGMRMARAGARDGDRDSEILAEIRARAGDDQDSPYGRNPFDAN